MTREDKLRAQLRDALEAQRDVPVVKTTKEMRAVRAGCEAYGINYNRMLTEVCQAISAERKGEGMDPKKVIVRPPNEPDEAGVTTANQCRQTFDAKDGSLLCCVRAANHPPPCHVLDPLNQLVDTPIGQVGYEAYAQSTGGKTWDGKPMPTWAEVEERAPHVARAWNAAAAAILKTKE